MTDPPTALDQLLARARGPLGPAGMVNLGEHAGPIAQLAALLERMNGFYAFNAGVQVFHVGQQGLGPELTAWNSKTLWKDTYQGLADDLFCFGQDVLGTQFAIVRNQQVVRFEPETGQRTVIGGSLGDWAAWLLDDPAVNATAGLAGAWQDAHGALTHDERLMPRQLLVLGGALTMDNLVVNGAATCMRIRGPIAHQIHDLPDGATIRLDVRE